MRVAFQRFDPPACPAEIRDEVEKYAREWGRTGKVQWAPVSGWFAEFSLKPDDPRMVSYQAGLAAEPEKERVWFHRQKPSRGLPEYEPLDIVQMGAAGVREFLDRGNLWSGRGEFRDMTDKMRKTFDANGKVAEVVRAEQKEKVMDHMKDHRRSLLKIPFLGVGVNLKEK